VPIFDTVNFLFCWVHETMIRFLALIALSFFSVLLCSCDSGDAARKDAETKRVMAEANRAEAEANRAKAEAHHSEAEANRFQAAATLQEKENRKLEIQMQDRLQQAAIDQQSKYLVILAIVGIVVGSIVIVVLVFSLRKNNSFNNPRIIPNNENQKVIQGQRTRELQYNQKTRMALSHSILKQGKVRHYNERAGWGHIECENGINVFFHISCVQPKDSIPIASQKVEFEDKESTKKPGTREATKVMLKF